MYGTALSYSGTCKNMHACISEGRLEKKNLNSIIAVLVELAIAESGRDSRGS